MTHLINLEHVSLTYRAGARPTLQNISLTIPSGQSCALVGPSGSGKSTLLNLIGLLDQPTAGRLCLAGRDFAQADGDTRARARNQLMGFVFQSFNLLPRLDALDNVALPLLYRGHLREQARQQARLMLERVGLAQRTWHRPAELSGGQRQRVAIARALIGQPALLLADEPTGNLDSQSAEEIIALLQTLNREQGVTLLMVTHDLAIARQLQRCIRVSDGQVQEQGDA